MTKCDHCAELEKQNAELASKLKMTNAMFVSAQNTITALRRLNDTLRARVAVMRTKQEGK